MPGADKAKRIGLSTKTKQDKPEAVDIKSPASRHEQITLKHLITHE